MDSQYKAKLKRQGYIFTGDHSACKICLWTKKSLRGKSFCYKQQFYGIRSHRCAQISVSVNYCPMDCVFCWRERNNSPYSAIDDPKEIIANTTEAQRKLLSGFGGNVRTEETIYEEARNPMHYAISLTGETLTYPRLDELVDELEKQDKTSFIVTNGQYPEIMEKMAMPTQLYVSLSAPNEELFKKIDRSMFKDGWQRLMDSFDVLSSLKGKTRTTVRMTMIKGINMVEPENYVGILARANPLFAEVKAYMYLGASRKRLTMDNMPSHQDIMDFAEQICAHSNYKVIDEKEDSRVALLMKRDVKDRIMRVD